MRRWRMKGLVLVLICIAATLALAFYTTITGSWSTCRLWQAPDDHLVSSSATCQCPLNSNNESLPSIACIINGDLGAPLSCRLHPLNEEVYVPFSFIERYFEMSGKLEMDKKHGRVFNWQHSYAKLILPKLPYQVDGIFMSFDNYNVEVRDRVKCISAMQDVPVSSQWSLSGHFYPIQIAQFGLSHYSKNISDEPPRRRVVADFEKSIPTELLTIPVGYSAQRVQDEQRNSWILNFTAPEGRDSAGISLVFPDSGEPYVLFDLKLMTPDSSLSVHLQVQEKDKQLTDYHLLYSCTNITIALDGNRVIYGIGTASQGQWRQLIRDVYIDLIKGLNLRTKKPLNKRDKIRLNISRLRVLKIELRGHGYVDNLAVTSSAHSQLFYHAADWLVKNQDARGGWPIMVKRKLGPSELQPGWYSAMAQGQAMSTLTRAYRRTNNSKYLRSAVDALKLFSLPAEDGGITAIFLKQYTWYEEYPTSPPSFVLNGFIYALLGLYDVSLTSVGDNAQIASNLLEKGMESLKALLPFFDTGSGSIYDLRHFTLKSQPNLARWDYHSTHVTQLLVLNSIHPIPIFAEFAQRWSDYMKGKRASHN